MNTFTLILQEESPTPVMRSLAKYLKSQGYQVPELVNAGIELKIQSPEDQSKLAIVLQNYIGSAEIKEIRLEEI